MNPKIVLSGIGMCTSIGATTQETWDRVKYPGKKSSDSFSVDLAMRSPRAQAEHLSFSAVRQALIDAGLWQNEALACVKERVACTFSLSKPLFAAANSGICFPPEQLNQAVCDRFVVKGERRNVVAACATGAYAAALGAQWIDQGFCDVVIAGSVEPFLHPLLAAGFAQMGVLSSEAVMRPFDRERSGFVAGAGAGAAILESVSHARARGHMPNSFISGWGLGADAHSSVAFNSQGARIADVIEKARRRAGLSYAQITHVNAHGTATRLNDRLETSALTTAFGRAADHLMISATKSTTGHLLGAAGSVELALTALALRDQFIPPTGTLRTPDPDCPLDYTPRQGRAAVFDHALSLSFGFGGSIGALLLSR